MKKQVLELFAGARCVGRQAESMGMEVFSADWTKYDNINFVGDIANLTPNQIPFIPDVIWASPDCTTYTISACSTHRIKSTFPKTDYARQCDATNRWFIHLIKYYLTINPDIVFFIENPRGMMRKQPWMIELEESIPNFRRETVWYCQYGDDRGKPTDIWTNSLDWSPRPMCKNFKYDADGEIIDKHCHHQSARRGAKTGTQGRKNAHERSFIPQQLTEEILQSTILDISKVFDVELDDVDSKDYPDFCDAYVSHAMVESAHSAGRELTESEYQEISDDHSDWVQEQAHESFI
jgi:hypothetical protein